MNSLDRMIGYFAPERALKRTLSRQKIDALQRAGYEAAAGGRRGNWSRGSDGSQNAVNRADLTTLRQNSRELERNNPYHKVAIDRIATLMVGKGIQAVAKSRRSDKRKRIAQEAFSTWASSTDCDVHGRQNLGGILHSAARAIPRDGDSVLLPVFVARADRTPGKIPLKLQLVDADFIDSSKDGVSKNDSTLVQGVKQRPDGSIEGYWLFDSHPGEQRLGNLKSTFVSADRVFHAFDATRPGQLRGVPWGVSAFTRIKGLDDFRDARVEQQKIAASFGALIRQAEENENKIAADVLPEKIEPGMLARLYDGEDVTVMQPPAIGSHTDFVQPEERVIASAYGITYEELVGDYSTVNFASGKMARLAMYQNVSRWQHEIIITQLCKRIEQAWLIAAASVGLDVSDVWFDWRPPRKEILDLKNELPALVREVRAGYNSWTNVLRERGIDPEAMAAELKADQDLWDKFGLVLDIDARQMSFNGQAQSMAPQSEEDSTDA